jgi:hypothetical protein
MPKGDNFKGGKLPNSGRKPGTPNKENKALREMILGALDKVGGEDYLARQAIENPGPFMGLIGKVLPTTLVGEGTQPIAIRIERVIVDADQD